MISIVFAYYQRREQLFKTLDSIEKSKIKDYELVIVDDASPNPLVCPQANVIRIEPHEKWYTNPCVPFNRGLSEAKGDIIIIQNPECYHVGDILNYVQLHLEEGEYFSFACYAMNKADTAEFFQGEFPVLNGWKFRNPERNGWFNHSVCRPIGYHFCSAITRDDLDRIGGFDERYAGGISFEDDEFIRRVKENLKVHIIDTPFVLHQYHHPFCYHVPNMMELHEKNKKIFNEQ
jgi:GT2 family glycosyltransferase